MTATQRTLDKLPAGTWELFQPDANEDAAAARFFAKHGMPPLFIHDVCIGEDTALPTRVMALGPIDGKEANDA